MSDTEPEPAPTGRAAHAGQGRRRTGRGSPPRPRRPRPGPAPTTADRDRAAGPAASGRRAGCPPASSPCWCSAGAGLLLYDVAAVRAGRTAMPGGGTLADELATRPLDDVWVIVGAAAVAVALGLWLLVLARRPPVCAACCRCAAGRTAGRPRRAGPARRRTGAARPGDGGVRRAVRPGRGRPPQGQGAGRLALPRAGRGPRRPGRRPRPRACGSWGWPASSALTVHVRRPKKG